MPGSSVIQAIHRQATAFASVTVHEAGIGKMAYTGRALEWHIGCEMTDWVLDPSPRCKVRQGVQGLRQSMVTFANRSEIATHVWSPCA